MAIFYGTIFYHLPTGVDANCYLNRTSIMFFSILFVLMAHQPDVPEILEQRLLFNRERSLHVVSNFGHYVSRILLNFPINMACVFIYVAVLYYLCSLRAPFENFMFFYYILMTMDFIAYFVAMIVAGLAPTNQVGMSAFPIFLFFALGK